MNLTISYHARKRWAERFKGRMEDSLARAVPFGAQRGSDSLLRSDNAVFVVSRDGVVKTVLSLNQAYANMQSNGIKAAVVTANPRDIAKKMLVELADSLIQADDDSLVGLGQELGVRRLAEHIFSLRKRLAKSDDALVRLYRGEMGKKIRNAVTDAANRLERASS